MQQKSFKEELAQKIKELSKILSSGAACSPYYEESPDINNVEQVRHPPLLTNEERKLLSKIRSHADISILHSFNSVTQEEEEEEKKNICEMFLAILNAKKNDDFGEAKNKLNEIKTASREAIRPRPYNELHYFGFGIGVLGLLAIVVMGLTIFAWPIPLILGVVAIGFFATAAWSLHSGKTSNDEQNHDVYKRYWEEDGIYGKDVKNFIDVIYGENERATQNILIKINSEEWEKNFSKREESNEKKKNARNLQSSNIFSPPTTNTKNETTNKESPSTPVNENSSL